MELSCASVLQVTYGLPYPCPFVGMLVASGDKALLLPTPACWICSWNADAILFAPKSTSRVSKHAQCDQTEQRNLPSYQRLKIAESINTKGFSLCSHQTRDQRVLTVCTLHSLELYLMVSGSRPISDAQGFCEVFNLWRIMGLFCQSKFVSSQLAVNFHHTSN